jgi:nickel transport system ATP-binding protein
MMLLHVDELSIRLKKGDDRPPLVSKVGFSLAHDECLGIVGESGSGKSLTAYAINGLLADCFAVEGTISFEGRDLLALPESERRAMRGKRIAMVLQNPMSALNPLFTVGNQVVETLCRHTRCSAREALETMEETFDKVKLRDPKQLFGKYPHELSGGMLQRVIIAFAIALQPALVIADEPTTAIDYISQREVINELRAIRERFQTSIIFISHDLSLVSHIADRVLVMKRGAVVEQGSAAAIFAHAANEHTRYLIETRMQLIRRLRQMTSPVHAAQG